MKKIICVFILFFVISFSSFAFDISAESAILYDCLTNSIVFEKNSNIRRPIASTTKIMTGLLASTLYDLEEEVTIRQNWCNIEGSSMYLAEGEKLKVSDLVYGLLLASGNDAATALSALCENQSFVELMNIKASELGLKNTHYDNPTGLDSQNHYSTAYDLALLTNYALKNDFFSIVCSTKQKTIGNRFMANHNKLLFLIDGCIGVKTGYTDDAGRCLVSAVCRNNRTFIAVTLNAPDDWNDHKKMYEYAFNDVEQRLVVEQGLIGYIDVAGKGNTPVCIKNDINIFLSKQELDRLEISLKGQRIVYSGIRSGDEYGLLTVRLDGQIIHSEKVYYEESIPCDKPKYTFWEKIIMFFSKR